ncbi:hypothetical protein A9995_09200 [Erythrobacter sp. QSSC1-22B]|uniref:DUF3667 domain-containing protein n=1 Tax=Erythrobacter sp. QSSC1-22B TaxID=1860125 RepID=UPI000805BA51|nr:DUF3667 domain-containing protein [Erythrobacter sp. QSSC1-22B]OBX18745.1 hypothetical protein A9995_09200 [Erythrobacter sp. QSSC1-22B]
MGNLGEAVSTAVERGPVSRAASAVHRKPGADARSPGDGHFTEATCLNCGTMLTGPHCHQCGQKAHLHRTIGAFLHDLLHGALHFDGKTWRTLPKLVFKPGELTRRYIDGERARFVSPMALFLFAVFLMFAVFQVIGLTPPTDIQTGDGVNTSLAEVQESLVAERELVAQEPADSPRFEEAQRRLAEIEQRLEAVAGTEELLAGGDGMATASTVKTGAAWIDKGLDKWRTNPGLMLYKLQANSYKFSWLLIPLSVPFVWLLFAWKRNFKAYDHAIFVTYSLAFMSLLFIVLSVLGMAGAPSRIVATATAAIPPIHIYKQMRGTYALSRFSALWRLGVLLAFVTIIVMLFLQILLMLGAY